MKDKSSQVCKPKVRRAKETEPGERRWRSVVSTKKAAQRIQIDETESKGILRSIIWEFLSSQKNKHEKKWFAFGPLLGLEILC